RDVFAALLREGIAAGELPDQDVETVAAGLVGAIGEALVGPLSPAAPGRRSRNEALVASLVQFCLSAIGEREEPSHGRDATPRRPAPPPCGPGSSTCSTSSTPDPAVRWRSATRRHRRCARTRRWRPSGSRA